MSQSSPQFVTPEQLLPTGRRFSRLLDEVGVSRRGTVAILAENTAEFLWAYRGATWSGRMTVPVSWRWSARDIAYVLKDAGVEALVVDAAHAALIAEAAELVPAAARFCFGGQIPGFRDLGEAVAVFSDEEYESSLAGDVMPYTSGTTGRPKGVERPRVDAPPPTFSGIKGAAMLERSPEALGGPHLVCTPLYHAAPLFYSDGALLLGCDLVLMEKFDPEGVLAAIEKFGITSTFMVPTQFVRLLALDESIRNSYDLSSMKLIVHGSAAVAPAVKRAMIDWFGSVLYEFYGGSEGGGATGISSADWLTHPGSVGQITSGTALRILDEQGNELPPHTEGEVWFEGGQTWSYRDDAEKTAKARQGNRSTLGDIGYLDEDGFLYLCDRRTDVVITGGMNVYPAQVEGALLEHPAIADACVIGVPDEEWGHRVTALVELHSGVETTDDFAAQVIAFARERLAGYQTPRQVEVRADLPRTETGKLSRTAVRAAFLAELADAKADA